MFTKFKTIKVSQQLSLALLLACALHVSSASASTSTDFAPAYGTGISTDAQTAIDRAVASWSTYLKDPVAVNLNFEFRTLAAGTITETSPGTLYGDYDQIRSMLVNNAGQPYNDREQSLLPNLPTASQFAATVPEGFSVQKSIAITQANYHALGGTGFTGSDGSIVFSNNVTWDFDRTDGITAGSYDFQGVAMHEIGHALGFTTELDYVDRVISDGLTRDTTWPTVMDLFRFNSAALDDPSFDFTTTQRNLTPGGSHAFYLGDDYLDLSTGEHTGDGQQGEHWKNNLSLGLMDPLAPGKMIDISNNDLAVMDLIGWDVEYSAVPEPATLILLSVGALALGRSRRK
ncbi:hypothetical protein STSP2_00929 [Anaerohalosphaera lusitana]|uniref:Ice-binding protein C-terminal domain-containing protein n=1 Tax=Anaerohalosphaera lusitana TaxID=1936003 RepID=A0A1U9NJM6_9BACT|nr:NF038122 family metalloprotease [Anaerohalosphaera lusitana]AQT67780.1 hypothetical protein STSP2_00929 [Anaerohalosphaera lusitana]